MEFYTHSIAFIISLFLGIKTKFFGVTRISAIAFLTQMYVISRYAG